MNNFHPTTIARFAVVSAALLAMPSARAELDIQGTPEQKKLIDDAIAEIQKDSPTAKAIIDELKGDKIGKVVVKIGDTADVATANPTTKVITIDAAAIAKFKQVGSGKALEQSSVGYILLHEGWHVLRPRKKGEDAGDDENKTVSKINEVQTERKSATRGSYSPDSSDGRLLIPFSDGSKLDVTDAFKSSAASAPVGKFVEMPSTLQVKADRTPNGEIHLTLAGEAPQFMTMELPPEAGGGSRTLQIFALDALLVHETGTDFPLTVCEFGLDFASFDLLGRSTGANHLGLYFDHQTPFGTWDLPSAGDGSFAFDFAGDLGWSSDLFDFETGGIAVERLTGTMTTFGDGHWQGLATLEGLKFAPVIPEPATWLLTVAGLAMLAMRKRLIA